MDVKKFRNAFRQLIRKYNKETIDYVDIPTMKLVEDAYSIGVGLLCLEGLYDTNKYFTISRGNLKLIKMIKYKKLSKESYNHHLPMSDGFNKNSTIRSVGEILGLLDKYGKGGKPDRDNVFDIIKLLKAIYQMRHCTNKVINGMYYCTYATMELLWKEKLNPMKIKYISHDTIPDLLEECRNIRTVETDVIVNHYIQTTFILLMHTTKMKKLHTIKNFSMKDKVSCVLYLGRAINNKMNPISKIWLDVAPIPEGIHSKLLNDEDYVTGLKALMLFQGLLDMQHVDDAINDLLMLNDVVTPKKVSPFYLVKK